MNSGHTPVWIQCRFPLPLQKNDSYAISSGCLTQSKQDGIDKIISNPTKKWADGYTTITGWQYGYLLGKNEGRIKLTRFLLENIDEMREQLMLNYNGFDIFSTGITPYSYLNQFTITGKYTTQFNQEGLGIRTYKSDIYYEDGVAKIKDKAGKVYNANSPLVKNLKDVDGLSYILKVAKFR